MTNFIFISPNFPENYWQFCYELKQNGLNVLGIGDQPYDDLTPELKNSLNEYYKVDSLENYDEVYRAVAFFTFKYGRIDWLESNNEYWLEQDARLRTDFNINSGFKEEDMGFIKYKSEMKAFYEKANIPCARYYIIEDYEGCLEFINEVGYPVIVKPNNGVGASDTYKLDNQEELDYFLGTCDQEVEYIMEEFINGEVDSYDAIVDGEGNPIFETSTESPINIMDIVNDDDNAAYHVVKNVPEDLVAAGRATVKSFGVKNRFVHFEFFRLYEDHPGLGNAGEIVALEVNMRPCGGITPEMMNYANSTSVYKIWADMIAFGDSMLPDGQHYYCAFAGRRDGRHFDLSEEDIYNKYHDNIKQSGRVADALASTMGNYMYLANFDTEEELNAFYEDVLRG